MTKRERFLTTALVGTAVVLGGGFLFHLFVYQPLSEARERLARAQEGLIKKQNELTGQLVRANHELDDLEAASTDIKQVLNEALDLVRDCAAAYERADVALRREWNQAFFERMEVLGRTAACRFPHWPRWRSA